ncbi:hypothetical protein TorRG33x02_087490 [Trema orientale]|uniref:Transmembrane protein n=1 Tax=Trema orientale TaxID=63057 RepID=A0A2P5FBR2_TREOI|nr:hypothetical protein TorRG33x02_087490 [Trema orientale]
MYGTSAIVPMVSPVSAGGAATLPWWDDETSDSWDEAGLVLEEDDLGEGGEAEGALVGASEVGDVVTEGDFFGEAVGEVVGASRAETPAMAMKIRASTTIWCAIVLFSYLLIPLLLLLLFDIL